MKTAKAIQPKISEYDLQRACISFFQWKYPHLWRQKRLHAVPNGGTRNPIEAVRLKHAGVVAGIPDIMLTVPNKQYAGMFCELKVGRNTLSEHQKAFIEAHKNEYYIVVIRSLDEFMKEINNYLQQ